MIFQTLIVDDEPLIAFSISKIIAKINASFHIAKICYNGQEALTYMQSNHVDVVFTDIQMPLMDGLTLTHEIKKINSSVQVVILSGYSEFEYAQKAISEGVADYLLKPLNRDKAGALLNRLEKELSLRLYSDQINVLGKIINDSEKPAAEKEMKALFPYETYCLFLICSKTYLHAAVTPGIDQYRIGNSNFIYQECCEIFSDNPFWVLEDNSPNEKFLIVGCSSFETTAINALFPRLHQKLCQISPPVTSVICGGGITLEGLKDAFKSMRRFLCGNLIFGQSRLYCMDEKISNRRNPSDYLTEEKKKYLLVLFRECHQKQFNECVSSILDTLCKNEYPQISIEEYMKTIIQLILPELKMGDSLFFYYDYIYEITSDCCDQASLNKEFLRILDDFFKLKNTLAWRSLPQNRLVQQVKIYIEEHFTEPINIQTIATRFGVVAPYLSKLYYDYYQSSLKNDILKLRLNKAEELLKIDPPLPLREIAELTGFNDPFYFSKIFKKERSVSPVDFRKIVNNEIPDT